MPDNIKELNCCSRKADILNINTEENVKGLVTSCNSVGSKISALYERKLYKTIALDLAAANLNELACSGCRAVGFADYITADNSSNNDGITQIRKELNTILKEYNCPILGGQIREDDYVIKENNIDICGFALGINPISKPKIVSGDIVVGLSSNGLHITGFSLVRKLYLEGRLTEEEYCACLAPSYIYYKEVVNLFKQQKIKDCVNITCGGIYGSVNRILPKGLKADLNLKHIPPQPIFNKIKELCPDEFYNIFNAGIGFCLIAERASNEIFFEDCKKFNPIVLGVIE